MRPSARRLLRFLPIAVLAAENLVVFGRHYFGGYGFLWDFNGAYYAATAYWTEAVARGPLPMWMPFQWMGYPFLLNLQTGIYYPPLWVFPLLHIPYTLPAAVVVQCLHVFAGALGMYVLARGLLRSRREALLAAFAFQLFGGFYSNAQHVDIIRAFALTPWLLWACLPPRAWEGTRLSVRTRLVPLFVFAMAVGGYPGNLLGAILLVSVFAACVLVQRRFARATLVWTGALAASALLGLLMAAIHLGPPWMYRAEMLRYYNSQRIFRASLGVVHLPGLVLENRGMPIDASMTSTFVGVAVLAGLSFLGRRSWRRFWPFAAVALVAVAMVAGDSLPLSPLLRRLIPPLGYSRFPSSDYRGFLAVLLVLLAAAGWRDLRHRRSTPLGLLLRFLPAAIFVAWSLARVYPGRPYWPDRALAEVAVLGTLAAFAVWRIGRPAVGVAAMLAAISVDAAGVLPRLPGWVQPDLIATSRTFAPTPAKMYDSGRVVAPGLFEERPGPRPARLDGDGPYRSSGYLQGDFLVFDFGPAAGLRASAVLYYDKSRLAFMQREWTPVVIEPVPPSPGGRIEVVDLLARTRAAGPDPRVIQESLGIDSARYRVDSDRPFLLVENEVFFPGWTWTRLTREGASSPEPAVRVNEHLRGWILPAGRYAFVTRFRLAGLWRFAVLSATAWILWLAWLSRTKIRPRRSA